MPAAPGSTIDAGEPLSVGIGLREPHFDEILSHVQAGDLTCLGPVDWLEVHSENFLWAGPGRAGAIRAIAGAFALSLHGVGMSLGNPDGLCPSHLDALHRLARDLAPQRVSEHACWSSFEGAHFHDLLPLPFDEASLGTLSENIERAQDSLGRQLLVENLSAYVALSASEMPEWEFMRELCQRSGCALLLDVNNVWVSALNLGFDPLTYLDGLHGVPIGEIHVAGHTKKTIGERTVLIDDHAGPVSAAVWQLYAEALTRFGAVPTLIEWDRDLPALEVLTGEAARALEIAAHVRARGDELAA